MLPSFMMATPLMPLSCSPREDEGRERERGGGCVEQSNSCCSAVQTRQEILPWPSHEAQLRIPPCPRPRRAHDALQWPARRRAGQVRVQPQRWPRTCAPLLPYLPCAIHLDNALSRHDLPDRGPLKEERRLPRFKSRLVDGRIDWSTTARTLQQTRPQHHMALPPF